MRHWVVRQLKSRRWMIKAMIEVTETRRQIGTKKRITVASLLLCGSVALWLFYFHATGAAQSVRNPARGKRVTVASVFAHRVEDPNKARSLLSGDALKKEEEEKIIPKQALEFYDGGVRQEIQAFSPDPTPARIVVLM